MTDFVSGIEAGCIPVPILNTTIMENGHRIMITPIDFTDMKTKRAQTLSEYLFKHNHGSPEQRYDVQANHDIGLWTAARLSATFPYISPATRAELTNTMLHTHEYNERFLGHHFIDGGYHDNYGVASAIDWLEPVLEAREKSTSGVTFKRLLIIQLRVSSTGDGRHAFASSGTAAAFLGPLLGIFSIRDGVAFNRNEAELERFTKAWIKRFAANQSTGPVAIETVIIEPKRTAEIPLSWHLTSGQIRNLRESWHSGLDDCLSEINTFLDGTSPAISSKCRTGQYD
ncbi:hypothetical protein KFU94_07995 [Chloroflexi bacterium TSY]|nr:hypothetical protein [Chloroflexi bacterium TSY]